MTTKDEDDAEDDINNPKMKNIYILINNLL